MAEVPTGLRERKKHRTREAIVDAALALFSERGFDATTVADIAAAADIAPRTFFSYFASKEDVVFWDSDEAKSQLVARLRDRAPGETAIDAMRGWIAELVGELDFDDARMRCRRSLVACTPALAAHDRALMGRFEAALAEGVADDLGLSPASLRPRMIAAAATAALTTLESFYEDREEELAQALRDPLAVVDEALVFLRGGIAALQDRPQPPV